MSRGRREEAGSRSRREFPRTLRVNQLLQRVVASELERLVGDEGPLITVTGVDTDAEFHRALVFVDHLDDETAQLLADLRPRLQRAVGAQVRLRRTPELRFLPDPAIAAGERIDSLLQGLAAADDPTDDSDPASEAQ